MTVRLHLRSRKREPADPEPSFNKFCFLFPMLPSFLVWGFAKLIVSTIMLACLVMPTFYSVKMLVTWWDWDNLPPALTFWMLSDVFSTDIALHVTLIIGVKWRSEKLLKTYCTYSMVLYVFTPCLLAMYLFLLLSDTVFYVVSPGDDRLLAIAAMIMFCTLGLQIYVTMLVRIEAMKFRHNRLLIAAINDININIEDPRKEALLKEKMANNKNGKEPLEKLIINKDNIIKEDVEGENMDKETMKKELDVC